MVTWLSDNIGAISSAVNIGIIRSDKGDFLVDTGIDNNAVNKVLKSIDTDIDGAFVTHHHADHMGGCSKLLSLGKNQIYGPKDELAFFNKPFLEPFTMFGGAYPPNILRNRHLEARECNDIKSSSKIPLGEDIPTPGHTPGHIAYLYDEILFAGDAAFTQETIEKYKLLFAVDPKQAAKSAEKLQNIEFDAMVSGHGPIIEDRKTAIRVLSDTVLHYQNTRELILSIIGERHPMNSIVSRIIEELEIDDIVQDRGYLQFILYQVPIRGYISNLLDDELISIEMDLSEPQLVSN